VLLGPLFMLLLADYAAGSADERLYQAESV
jgi:hypothetical protein